MLWAVTFPSDRSKSQLDYPVFLFLPSFLPFSLSLFLSFFFFKYIEQILPPPHKNKVFQATRSKLLVFINRYLNQMASTGCGTFTSIASEPSPYPPPQATWGSVIALNTQIRAWLTCPNSHAEMGKSQDVAPGLTEKLMLQSTRRF